MRQMGDSAFWRSCLGNRGPGLGDTAMVGRAVRAKRKYSVEEKWPRDESPSARLGLCPLPSLEFILRRPTESTRSTKARPLRVSLLLSGETSAPSGGKFYIRRETSNFGRSISPQVSGFVLCGLFLSFLGYATL